MRHSPTVIAALAVGLALLELAACQAWPVPILAPGASVSPIRFDLAAWHSPAEVNRLRNKRLT